MRTMVKTLSRPDSRLFPLPSPPILTEHRTDKHGTSGQSFSLLSFYWLPRLSRRVQRASLGWHPHGRWPWRWPNVQAMCQQLWLSRPGGKAKKSKEKHKKACANECQAVAETLPFSLTCSAEVRMYLVSNSRPSKRASGDSDRVAMGSASARTRKGAVTKGP